MPEPTQLDRVEALLAELVRRFTPREAISALEARLAAYPGSDQAGAFRAWITGASPTIDDGV